MELPQPSNLTRLLAIEAGSPTPLGAHQVEGGINFAFYSAHTQPLTLCLYDPATDEPLGEVPFDPEYNRTGEIWHLHLTGLPLPVAYTYRLNDELVDPYAQAVTPSAPFGMRQGPYSPKALVTDESPFDWEEVPAPHHRLEELILYEMHLRGFTQSAPITHPGTFAGLIEKIPYLLDLGINAVELLPIFEFDECAYKPPLLNYWGYATQNFFTPMTRYGTKREFQWMVRELHRAGIEVILDVVYNHTGEGALHGPIYYITDPEGRPTNYSGCGNTLNANHPIVQQLILDSLRYWVTEMHVDGFRFDLASVLTRASSGEPLSRPPLIETISADPILADTKLIAEPWGAGGLYQVGQFSAWGPWSEWNGRYRDAVRRFLKGDPDSAGPFATALCGSPDLYSRPASSVNFVTCHDGFSLADLVSYNQKHNEANGEENRDGSDYNDSWNCGVEGPTNDPTIVDLRNQQMRNFLLALFVSQGIPMLHMGDEQARTAHGNNNTWCHDSPLNWFDWKNLDPDLYTFTKELIALRKSHPELRLDHPLTDADITWHGRLPHQPDWSGHLVAFTIGSLYIAFNAGPNPIDLTLPKGNWKLLLETGDSSRKALSPHSALVLTLA